MIALQIAFIGVRCPSCGKNNIEPINRFQFASGSELFCPYCGTHILSITKSTSRGNLHVNCFACGESHTYSLSARSLFSGVPASFNCKVNDIEVIYAGNEQDVSLSLDKLSDELNFLTEKYYESFRETYGSRCVTALHILEQKSREKRIICLCGSCEANLTLSDDGIYLTCLSCGSSIFIPIATEEDIHSLMERRSILIR